MTDKEKKSKIADILMDFQEEYSNEVVNRPMLASLYAGNILSFIDPLQEELVSVWHNSNEEQPKFASTVVIWNPKYKNGELLSRCTKVYSDRIWAYIDDLLKK